MKICISAQDTTITELVLCLLLLCSNNLIHAFRNPHTKGIFLDITDNLKIFENCTVHIVQPILEDSMFSYTVHPPNFPIVYSEYLFVRNWLQGLVCNSQLYALARDQEIPNNATPFYSATCEATVYIIPPDCNLMENSHLGFIPYFSEENILMPASAKELMVHPLVRPYKLNAETIKMPATCRAGIYFIAIGTLQTLNEPWLTNIFRLVDIEYSWESVFLPRKIFVQVTLCLEKNIFDGHHASVQTNPVFMVGNIPDEITRIIVEKGIMNGFTYKPDDAYKLVSVKIMFSKLHRESSLTLMDLETGMWNNILKSGQNIWETQCPNEFTMDANYREKNVLQVTKNIPKQFIFLTLIHPNATTIIDYKRQVDAFPVFVITEEQNQMQFINFEKKGYHFVTCADVLETGSTSFYGFISAFDYKTWALILISWLTLALFVQLRERKTSFTAIIFPLSNLLEHENNICSRYKVLTTSWLLMCIILSESYKGENVTELTAPLEPEKLQYFQQLVKYNFSILSKPELVLEKWMENSFDFAYIFASHFFGKVIIPQEQMLTGFDTAYRMHRSNDKKLNIIDQVSALIYKPTYVNDVNAVMKISGLFNITANCARMAYIDEYEDAHKMYLRLKAKFSDLGNHTSLRRLSFSKESLGKTVNTWLFKNIRYPATKFIIRVHSLLESGLVDAWNRWSFRISTWNDTVEIARLEGSQNFKALSVHGNVKVVFFLYLVIIFVSTALFLVEIREYIFKTLSRSFLNSICECFGRFVFYLGIKRYILLRRPV